MQKHYSNNKESRREAWFQRYSNKCVYECVCVCMSGKRFLFGLRFCKSISHLTLTRVCEDKTVCILNRKPTIAVQRMCVQLVCLHSQMSSSKCTCRKKMKCWEIVLVWNWYHFYVCWIQWCYELLHISYAMNHFS